MKTFSIRGRTKGYKSTEKAYLSHLKGSRRSAENIQREPQVSQTGRRQQCRWSWYTCKVLALRKQGGRTVGPQSAFCTRGPTDCGSENILRKIPGQSKKQNLNFPCASNCIVVISTYIDVHVLGIIGNRKMICSIQEDVYKLYENTIPFTQGT